MIDTILAFVSIAAALTLVVIVFIAIWLNR